MKKNRVISIEKPEAIADFLTGLLRSGATANISNKLRKHNQAKSK